ncbi:hypothetical protein KJ742_00980 [Patescibacteria group bacterium]|nr:hypothetical protein [Patescibacteria group bacterium]MBU1682497.1 hypothetical protein [Patescibacteria group bacterium]MBU1935283.1 hypothetical protein [Patescibacteria group bacterium]
MPPKKHSTKGEEITFDAVIDQLQEHLALDDRELLVGYLRGVIRRYLSLLKPKKGNGPGNETSMTYHLFCANTQISRAAILSLFDGDNVQVASMSFNGSRIKTIPQRAGRVCVSDAANISLVDCLAFRLTDIQPPIRARKNKEHYQIPTKDRMPVIKDPNSKLLIEI